MLTRRNRCRTVLERRGRTSRGLLLLAGLVAGAILVGSLIFDERGLPKYLEMRKRADRLESEIRDLAKQNADQRADIARLQRDPARIEALARERLGFVRKGETVYQIVEDSSGSANSR